MRFVSLRLTRPVTKTVTYTSLGNITSKSDVGGSYIYNQPGAARPHAVSRISGGTINGVVNPVYTYDANGNMLAGAGRALTYKSFNKVATITANGQTTSFTYDDGHGRIKKVTDDETVIYLGMTEKRISSTGDVKWYDYVEAEGRRVALRVFDQTTLTTNWRYYIHDHLGSAVVELDETGSVTERMSYDAWGKRRAPETAEFYAAGFVPVLTNNRGFTGHEHLDDVGLINMNARLYDPELGRFLQADTVTESLTYSQVFNRYTYVGNNPLSHTDPTGHSWLSKLFRKIPILRAIFQIAVAIVATWALGPAGFGLFAKGSAALAAASGFIAGGVASGSLKGAVMGGLTAGAFHGAGSFVDGVFKGAVSAASEATRFITHGLVGGIMSEVQGGKFGSGFLAAGVSSLATPYVKNMSQAKGAVVSAIVGGAASVAGGGKFQNGAVTGAFGYLFNCKMHGGCGENGKVRRGPRVGWNQHELGGSNGGPILDDGPRFNLLRWIKRLTPIGIILGAAESTPVGNGEVAEIPDTLARVYAGDTVHPTLGRPEDPDVFVTAYEDIIGLTPSQLASKLTIAKADSFVVISFPTPSAGLSTPINRINPGFVPGGYTAGGAREFTVPNGGVPSNAQIEIVE